MILAAIIIASAIAYAFLGALVSGWYYREDKKALVAAKAKDTEPDGLSVLLVGLGWPVALFGHWFVMKPFRMVAEGKPKTKKEPEVPEAKVVQR